MTLAYDLNTVDDWADLVEYAWGDATTTWGSVRIVNDSHPAPYKCSIFELGTAECGSADSLSFFIVASLFAGNEQENPDFVAQVTAMEARRTAPGVNAPEYHYMYPTVRLACLVNR